MFIQAAAAQIPQRTVVAHIALLIMVIVLFLLTLIFRRSRGWLTANKDLLQALASIATVLGVIVIAFTVIQVYLTYRGQEQTAQAQLQAQATNILQEHLTLATQYPELASLQTKRQIVEARYKNPEEVLQDKEDSTKARLEPKYVWFAAHATFTAEIIYNLTQDLETGPWEETVLGLVERHRTYVLHDIFPCEQHSNEFIRLLSSDTPLLTEYFKDEFSCKPA